MNNRAIKHMAVWGMAILFLASAIGSTGCTAPPPPKAKDQANTKVIKPNFVEINEIYMVDTQSILWNKRQVRFMALDDMMNGLLIVADCDTRKLALGGQINPKTNQLETEKELKFGPPEDGFDEELIQYFCK